MAWAPAERAASFLPGLPEADPAALQLALVCGLAGSHEPSPLREEQLVPVTARRSRPLDPFLTSEPVPGT